MGGGDDVDGGDDRHGVDDKVKSGRVESRPGGGGYYGGIR